MFLKDVVPKKLTRKNKVIGLLDVRKSREFRQSGDYLCRNPLCFSKRRLSSRCEDVRDMGRRCCIQTHRWADTIFVEISTQKFSRQPVALDRAEITNDYISRFTDNGCQEEEVQRLVFLERFIREHGFEFSQGRLDLELILWCQCLRLLGENQPCL